MTCEHKYVSLVIMESGRYISCDDCGKLRKLTINLLRKALVKNGL